MAPIVGASIGVLVLLAIGVSIGDALFGGLVGLAAGFILELVLEA